MSSSSVKRITVSLSPEVVGRLDYVSHKMRCSRSAFLSQLLSSSLPGLVELADCLPSPGSEVTGSDARRLRGISAKIIGNEVARLLSGGQDDLFTK